MKQMTLQEGMNSTMKQNLYKKWATFIYKANIPFNVAHHSAFINATKFTFEGEILYKPPSYHAIRTELLKSSKEDLSRCVMDGASNILKVLYPSLYFQGCATHCFDLLLEDWGKEQWVNSLASLAKTIVSFIQTHHMPLAIYH
jgi:hypothetical protein